MHDNRLFNYSALPQLVTDPFTDRVIAGNQEAFRVLEKDALELQATTVSELFQFSLPELLVFTEEAIEKGRSWCDRLLLGPNKIRVEVAARFSEAGDERYVYMSIQIVEEVDRLRDDSDAQHHYRSGIGHWNRVAKVFSEFERENQLLLEAAGEGIYGVDAQGNTTFVNPAAQRILGYTADELAGKNMHAMVHHSHADGSHFCSEECPIFNAFKMGVVQEVDDDVFWAKGGKSINVEYTSTPIMVESEIMGAVVVFRDVTQKKANHRQLKEALEEVQELKNRLEMENAYLQEEINSEFNHHQIIGKSQAIQNILQQVNMVGPTEATVLIHGESGTGKELIARAIHDESQRSGRSLIRVNCAAIPEDLFESEFFGHIKGAFTGATQDRAGRFQLADGGTLFLDEVGEIPLHLQSKLLRVLQEKQFERIGEAKTRSVDVRIIAATNRDLQGLVDQGRFREDLYFRLNVFPIHSAPLRQRTEDIPLLTQHFLDRSSARSGKPGVRISMGEIQKLQAYDWPGNIRELENVIERQVILAKRDLVKFDDLVARSSSAESEVTAVDESSGVMTQMELERRERQNLMLALDKCQGKVFGAGGAAELLGVKPTTLASKIAKMKINASQFKKQSA